MSYELPADVEQLVKQQMKSGAYASEDDVLRDALVALGEREEQRIARWNERNRLAIDQSRQGRSRPLDDATVLTRLRERLAQEGIIE